MAYDPTKDQRRHLELGSYIADFKDFNVMALEHVRDIAPLYPLKPMTTLIAVCNKGWQRIIANDHSLEITEGSVLICPPNIRVSGGEHSNDFECKVLSISDHLVRGLLRDKVDVWHHAVYVNQLIMFDMPDSKDEFSPYFTLVASRLKRNKPFVPYDVLLALLRAFFLELCLMLDSSSISYNEHKPSQGRVLFNRFLSLVSNSQIKRQPVATYASQLAITPKYLTMLCIRYSKKTASEWVAQYTVEEMRFYLRSSELSIKEISVLMGFSNMSHFGSYVRKHLGMSPTEFRNSKEG